LLATTALTSALWTFAPASATDWTGAASRDWTNGANWTGGVAPDSGIPVNIDRTSNAPVLKGGSVGQTGTLNVGATGSGALTVTNGYLAAFDSIFVGRDAGASGTIGATGANSFIQNVFGMLHLGFDGEGTLSLKSGADFYGSYAVLGSNSPASQGTLKLDGPGTTFYLDHQLHVGAQGTGFLSITNGAIASGSHAVIGLADGAVGTATVDGAGSQWSGYLFAAIGASGTGTLNLTNGGAFYGGYYGINGGGSYIGADATGVGTVNVRGAGSVFETSSLAVGFLGTGFLNITDGGEVRSIVLGGHNGNAFFGQGAGASGTVKIDGAGSLLDANLMIVGLDGTGVLAVSNDGTAKANQLYVAYNPGSFGTLNIGAASGSKAVAPGLINAPAVEFGAGTGTLVFNHTSRNYDFAPVITGNGSVTVEAGTTFLSGANTYTGDTIVNGGKLFVGASTSTSGLVFVNPGGTFGGTGTVGSIFLADFATLAPGMANSIGTLTIDGVLMMCGCSSYLVKADNLGNADKALVTGPAFLGGTLKVAPTTWIGSPTTYTIMSAAGGVVGAFGATSVTRPGWARIVDWTVAGDDVLLTLGRGSVASALPSGATTNQQAVGNAIDTALGGGVTPSAQLIALLGLTGSGLMAGLDQVSGQGAAQVTQTGTNASNMFMNAMFDPFATGRTSGGGGGAMSYASADEAMAYAGNKRGRVVKAANDIVTPSMRDDRFDPRWGVWASGYGGTTTTDGNAAVGSSDVRSSGYGVVAGADYRVSPQTIFGFALGGGGSRFTVSQGLGSGSADMFQAGLFARHDMGAAYLAAGGSYTYQDVTTTRTVTVAGSDQLEANFTANTFAGRAEGGYRLGSAVASVSPYAALQVTQINLPSYSEATMSGGSTFALSYGSNDTTITRTELGARMEHSIAMQAALLTLRGRAAWAHDEGNDGVVSATFASLPGSTFTINGAAPAKDLALVSAGVDLRLANNVSLGGSFEGEFSSTTRGYGGKGHIRYVW
jgi:T5SS/PEP-CTERM-associated repeat protein/autotransporter-associated beta strand protein